MIIRDNKSEFTVFTRRNKTIIALLVLGVIAWISIRYFAPFLTSSDKSIIICDAENVRGGKFITNGLKFDHGKTQSNAYSFSGNFSCRIDSTNNYGFGYRLRQLTPGDRYKVSVYRYLEGKLTANLVVSGKDFYRSQYLASQKFDNGWELLELFFNVPYDPPQEEIIVYVYKANYGNPAFFDDLRIEHLGSLEADDNAEFIPLNVDLNVDDQALRKLDLKRKEALKQGILISSDDDWVKGKIKTGDENIKVDLRLKGDWMDHLQGNKWSFRVKVKDPQSWNRMKTISFQNPKTRSFLREWVFHEFLRQEDVLSPRYDFMELTLSGKPLGIYAYEEHFDKQLPEFSHRREGPIIRFVEDAFWLSVQRQYDAFDKLVYSDQKDKALNAADVTPFKEGKTTSSETLSAQFEIAQSLMYAYKHLTVPVSDIFDLERLAKYYALVDINHAYHGLTWINQRMYYNPVISKLEPIGYDGFGENKHALPRGKYIAEDVYQKREVYKIDEAYRHLFNDEEFVERYIHYLYQFTDQGYINDFLQHNFKQIKEREKLIKKEFHKYAYDWEEIGKHARIIRNRMLPYNDVDVLFKGQEPSGPERNLSVSNYHYLPIKITGFGNDNRSVQWPVEESKLLFPNPKEAVPSYEVVVAPADAKFAFFQVPGIDSTFYSRISPWNIPTAVTPAQSLFQKMRLPEGDVVAVKNDSLIIFGAGSHQVKSDIIIPAGYSVSFEAGIEMDFINGAKFISRSPVYLAGTEAKPIRIFSSDQTANGFTVLQASRESILTYVHFDHLNTLNDRGWVLTGAVNFYESDVRITKCQFTNNHCEDGLNIIRSDFKMDHVLIANTFADGFDADFCNGSIKNTVFRNTGNDGMDMSGSVITIENCTIENAGDKGISVGEEATIHVISATVNGAVVGIASKDLSTLTVDYIRLENCQQGIAAYQKKPEFGGSTITIKDYSAENVKFLHQLEPGSVLELKGRQIKG